VILMVSKRLTLVEQE